MTDAGSLQYQAYHTIKELILSKSLDSDTLYSETKLARELGISRTPLREAIHCLSQDGYVSIIPSRGFRIRRLDQETMRESIEVRCAIEGFCVHLVTICEDKERREKLLQDMKASLDRQKTALTAKDFPASFTKEDHQFHLLLVHFADNSEFNHLFQRLLYTIHLTTANALSVSGRAKTTYEEHAAFYQHLKNGNRQLADRVLIDHLMMPLRMNII